MNDETNNPQQKPEGLGQDEAFVQWLRDHPPSRPDQAQTEQLAAAVDRQNQAASGQPTRKKLLPFTLIGSLGGLAAALAFAFLLMNQGQGPIVAPVESGFTQEASAESRSDQYAPSHGKKVLVAAEDEGLVMNDAEEPMRQIRYRYIETMTYVNPADGSSLRVQVPKEDIVRLPLQVL